MTTSQISGTGVPDTMPGAPVVKKTRFPCFDGLRAIAALTVIGVHTSFATGFTTKHLSFGIYTSRLEIGVEVFFVISGFLLYRPFVQARMSGGASPDMRKFWWRRLKRIVPAYWAAFLIITFLIHGDTYPHHTWDAPLIYMGFLQIYFPNYVLHGLGQAWSLCTEMSFYLFLPFYAWFLGRKRRSPDEQFRAEIAGLAVLVVASFAYRIPTLMSNTPRAHTMVVWLPGYLDQFALGMLLAVASCWLTVTQRRPAWLWHRATPWLSWALAALAFWAVSNIGLSVLPVPKTNPLGLSLEKQTLYGLFAFFLVLPAVFGPQDRGLIRWFLRWKPMMLIGVVSYGVYLWHESWMYSYLGWTGNKLFDIPWPEMYLAVAALAIGSATISYRLLERPILRAKPLRMRRPAEGAVPAPAMAGASR